MTEFKDASPPRTFVLIAVAFVLGAVALISADFSSPPTASAQTPTSYDLCDRQTAVRDAILLALQYPSRSIYSPINYGTVNSTYSSWGTLDTNTGEYTSVNCTSSNRLTISATALASDANWTNWRRAFDLNNESITALTINDFAGLTGVQYLYFGSNSITSLPDNIFQGIGVEVLYSNWGNPRLAPSWKWFGTSAP